MAQNRQDDRDRVVASEDRKRDQQNLEETQYLTREIASLRIALREVATRDFVRSELRDILEELKSIQEEQERQAEQLQDIGDDIEELEDADGEEKTEADPETEKHATAIEDSPNAKESTAHKGERPTS